MANTYSQISIHAIFAVKGRENFIIKAWREDLHSYIAGIINQDDGLKSLAVGGWKDHVHIFFGLSVSLPISDVLRIVKSKSSKWINDKKHVKGKFQWQEGYSAFSYSKSQRNNVIQYIINQEEHHRTKTFKEEYFEILRKCSTI